jgi:CO/xanthine dehydrogenase FAD-binding subunit
VKIGALTRIADLVDYDWPKSCEAFRQVAEKFAGPSIANVATVAGDVCAASPSSDLLPVLLCLNARAVLRSRKDDRVVGVSDLLLNERRTAVRPNEIVVEIQFVTPPTDALCVFKKIGRRSALFLASVSLAVFIQLDRKTKRIRQARVALNALSRNLPERSKLVEAAMMGKTLDKRTIDEAVSELSKELHTISDIRGSAHYKTEAAKALLEDQLLHCTSRFGAK